VTHQLTNLHGDVVATASPADTAAWSGATVISDEYGVTTSATTDPGSGVVSAGAGPRYGWLGAHQRATDGQGGLTLMGVRLYNPVTGLFLSTDPVYGGNPNTYAYPVNPITGFDLTGKCWGWGCEEISRAARTAWNYARAPEQLIGKVYRSAVLARGGSCAHYRHIWVCQGTRLYFNGGTTLGNTYSTGRFNPKRDAALLGHEIVHKRQWARYGYGFAMRYIRAGFNPCRNRYEIEAGLVAGGYLSCFR